MKIAKQQRRFGIGTRAAGVFMSAAILASSFTGLGGVLQTSVTADAASTVQYKVADQQSGSILQCFNWSFDAIRQNMATIAAQGFTAVQTSPIQTAKEATAGKTAKGSWWVLYQPADFTIETNANGTGALGTASQFKAMCDEAHKYGVRVIVDAVLNHMANKSKNDLSPTIPEKYRNNSNFWHDISKNSWYETRHDITQYCMDGVPDLNTGSQDVQNAAISFLKECIDCGADGFRFDGAKHIETPSDSTSSQFWPNVLNATTSYAQSSRNITPYYYGEVLDKPTGSQDSSKDQTIANAYTQYMSVTMSDVSNSIRGSVNSSDANGAKRSDFYFKDGGSVKGSKAVLWNESHDTYQAGTSSYVSDYNMNKTWALVGTRAEACGMYMARPSNWSSAAMGQGDVTAWANTEVKAVNEFHNAYVGKTEYLSSSGNVVYNERGTDGVVIVNVSGGSSQVSVKANKMAAGTYKDQITGATFTVSNGQISGQVGDTGIAVVYNKENVLKSAVVSAEPGSTTFTTDTLGVTLNVANASKGNYTTSEGKSGTYTNGQEITIGSSVAAGGSVTLTLSATGEDNKEVTATYTYTKKDPTLATKVYFDNSSCKWSNVYAYIYTGADPTPTDTILFSDTLGWGTVYAYFFANDKTVGAEWPGTKMTSNGTNEFGQGQFKISVPSGATHVIFNNGSGTQTGNVQLTGATGYYCDGSPSVVKTWTSTSSGAAATTYNAAFPGVKMTLDSTSGYYVLEVPSDLVNGKVIFSDGTETNRYPAKGEEGLAINDTTMFLSSDNTWQPYKSNVKVPTVTADKANGTKFTDETMTVKLSLANAVSGTYKVDGGPEKTFTSSASVVIGEGKIGDSVVTVEATAKGSDNTVKSYTFTYNKVYTVKTTSSGAASANTKYQTNPNGNVGANKTIKSASDFTAETLIAQGLANDDPASFRGTHEAPRFDLYALYAAWDSTNLYVGIQYTNVIDVVDPAQSAPQTGRGKPNGADADIPQMLLLDVRTGDYTDGKTNSTDQATVWNTNITFGGDTKVDKVIMYSPKEGIDNYAVFPVSNGVIDYTNRIAYGYQKPLPGASITWEDGFFGTEMNGLNKTGDGYTPADLESTSGNWVDFLTTNHSTEHDTFCIITMPLEYLGVSASDIADNGIGLMAVATYGESGIGCLPNDTVMLDNAKEAYASDDSTSGEKSDADKITVALASVGKSGGVIKPDPTTPLQVNFGTDKSAPQLATTALTLKGIGIGGTAPYKYQFSVDGSVVKASNTTATYTWKPGTSGKHTIKCVITDSTGATATVSKTFTAEGDSPVPYSLVNESDISSRNVEAYQPVTITGAASGGKAPYKYWFSYRKTSDEEFTVLGEQYGSATTATFYPPLGGTYQVVVRVKDANNKVAKTSFTVKAAKSTSTLKSTATINKTTMPLGSTVKMTGSATGGKKDYTYAFYFKRASNTKWKTLGTEFGTTNYAKLTPTGTGTYDLRVLVKDATGIAVTKTFQLKVTAASAALQNTSTISATSVKSGTAVKVTGKASGGTSPYKYAFYYKRTTNSSWKTIGTAYGTATTGSFTPTSAGTFDVKVSVKDNAGNIVTKSFTVTVK